MELGSQIKQHRKELGISQDELAERIFVSRQSISNWENNKTYPDIHTLLLLAETFGVSLDELIKGDVEEMKQEINAQERAGFNLDYIGCLIWGLLLGVAGYYCGRVELYKKMFDIQTYKEILAFDQGASLDELAAVRAQRPVRRWPRAVLMTLVSAAIGAICAYGGMWLLDTLGVF